MKTCFQPKLGCVLYLIPFLSEYCKSICKTVDINCIARCIVTVTEKHLHLILSKMLHFLLNCRVFEYLSIFLCLKIILVFGYLLTCRVVSACLTVMVKVIIQVTQYCRNEVVKIVLF